MNSRAWWSIGGIVQELVPPLGIDLRVIVAEAESWSRVAYRSTGRVAHERRARRDAVRSGAST
jgi:DMSO/TMAO reductase YedYZ molybdopterin-dependent catalytic subunit